VQTRPAVHGEYSFKYSLKLSFIQTIWAPVPHNLNDHNLILKNGVIQGDQTAGSNQVKGKNLVWVISLFHIGSRILHWAIPENWSFLFRNKWPP